MKIIYDNNKIFYIAIYRRRVAIMASKKFIRNKIRNDIHNYFVKNRNLLFDIETFKQRFPIE